MGVAATRRCAWYSATWKAETTWRTFADVELATAHWVEWYNARRLHSALGWVPPDEYEAAYYARQP